MKTTAKKITPEDYILSVLTPEERLEAAFRVAEEAFPDGEPGLGQLDVLRKFDQASRERTRSELLARVSPLDNLDLSASYSLTDDVYNEAGTYGMLKNRGAGPAFEVAYSPSPRFTLFGEYARELNTMSMLSRQRNPASGTAPANDKPDNDWATDVRDVANTYAVGLSGELLPGRLRAELSYSASDGNGLTQTRTPGTPDIVTTASQ